MFSMQQGSLRLTTTASAKALLGRCRRHSSLSADEVVTSSSPEEQGDRIGTRHRQTCGQEGPPGLMRSALSASAQ